MSTRDWIPTATRAGWGATARSLRQDRFRSRVGGEFSHCGSTSADSSAHGSVTPDAEASEVAVKRFLAGFSCTEVDLWEASPYRLLDPVESDAVTLLSALYGPDEFINIVAEFAMKGAKAHPIGDGASLKRDGWLTHFREYGPPESGAGVWIRPNPTDGKGISEIHIAEFRFAVLQFGAISIPLQLSFLARLPLPIAAIVASGGKSLHARIKFDSDNADTFRQSASRVCRILRPFGIDPANRGNRNPARLSRLPGVVRETGGIGDKRQRLLYLNPSPASTPILT